jgi:CheY-like chemotaxis protein
MLHPQLPSSTATAADRPVILVVDDDEAVLGSLKFALEVEGFRVLVFTSAEDLLRLTPLPASSCLVTDQRLPGKTGLELIGQLRARDFGFPAILITTQPTPPTGGGGGSRHRREAVARQCACRRYRAGTGLGGAEGTRLLLIQINVADPAKL